MPGDAEINSVGLTINFERQKLFDCNICNLLGMSKIKKVIEANVDMQRGGVVNKSEHRQALHTALRDSSVSGN